MTIPVKATSNSVRFDVHVTPRASANVVGGERDGRLIVRVSAAPVDDAANEAVVDSLARAFDVAKRQVRIAVGATSRRKTIEITGISAETTRARLSTILR